MAESTLKPSLPGTVVLLLLAALAVVAHWRYQANLRDTAILSGWTLAVLSLVLASYNLRKKLSSLPIGRAWYWRRFHVFAGWFGVVVFVVHAGVTPPDGWLTLLLWSLYLLALISGIAGLWLSNSLPAGIARGGERIQFERIPHLSSAQYRRAETVIKAAAADGIGPPLLEFYANHLKAYLGKPAEMYRHCFNNARMADELLRELGNIGRYVDKASVHHVAELERIITRKHVLDRQYAIQHVLKKWLWIHIGVNYMSWLFIALHVFASYAFRPEYGL